eukprot:c13135_g1_i4.p1 GENE.c13135_g1_i4~~c13135_g1_i4.p1  ORF type:complete len:223 (+),score=43.48 c13135_g1_i4:109-777(+)
MEIPTKELHIPRSTINYVRNNSHANIPASKGGRPKKISARNVRQLVRDLTSGTVDNAMQASKQLKTQHNLDVTPQTVRNALRQTTMKAVVKKKKPRFTSSHRQAHWTEKDWAQVVFSDETRINRIQSDGRVWAWKGPATGLTDKLVSPTVKFGGGNIMLWGCMNSQGVGGFCKIEGAMDASLYTSIMEDEMLDSIKKFKLQKKKWYFQQDNDPKHTSRLVTQ